MSTQMSAARRGVATEEMKKSKKMVLGVILSKIIV